MLALLFFLLNWAGFLFSQPAITHSGPPDLDAHVATALQGWGRVANLNDGGQGAMIEIQWIERDDPRWASGWAETYLTADRTEITRCVIGIGRGTLITGTKWLAGLVAHEVGHCLGFDHVAVPSVMQGANIGLTDYDYRAAAAVYGGRQFAHRITVPALAH